MSFAREADGVPFTSAPTEADGMYQATLVPLTAVLANIGPPVAATSRLLQNYPNPFNPSTLIPYYLAESGRVNLVVYDMLGKPVRALVDEVCRAGKHLARWHGQDETGRLVGAGVYVIRLETTGAAQSRKMVLVDGATGTGAGRGLSPARKWSGPLSVAPDLYSVVIVGDAIEWFVQRDLAVWADTTINFSVIRIPPPPPPAETPEQLIARLHRAMRERDIDLYETLLDIHFWFTEYDCQGELVFSNGTETELEILGGSRDGSQSGIFDIFRTTFEFTFAANARHSEPIGEYPCAYEGDPDCHPDEDWEVLRGRVQMLMIDPNGDGYRVDQVMTYKLRRVEEVVAEDERTVWKIVRWEDDPLAGDCGEEEAKALSDATTWGRIKASMAR